MEPSSHLSMEDMPTHEDVREQDRYLPVANIARIMKTALPNNSKIAKEAKETLQECVSEFISFITSEASEKCQQEKRKTINGDDVLWAMSTLGFDKYVEPLRIYLAKYRDVVKGGEKPPGPGGSSGSNQGQMRATPAPGHHQQQMSAQQAMPDQDFAFYSMAAASGAAPPSVAAPKIEEDDGIDSFIFRHEN